MKHGLIAVLFCAGCVRLHNDGLDPNDAQLWCDAWNSDERLPHTECDVSRVYVSLLSEHDFLKVTLYDSCGSHAPPCLYGESWPTENDGWQIVVANDVAHIHKTIRHELGHRFSYYELGNWDATHSDMRIWEKWGDDTVEYRANVASQTDGGVGL